MNNQPTTPSEQSVPNAVEPSDKEILDRFHRWQITLTEHEAHQFWADVDWLRRSARPNSEAQAVRVEVIGHPDQPVSARCCISGCQDLQDNRPTRPLPAGHHVPLPEFDSPGTDSAPSATQRTMRVPPANCRSESFRIQVDGSTWSCNCGASDRDPNCRRVDRGTK